MCWQTAKLQKQAARCIAKYGAPTLLSSYLDKVRSLFDEWTLLDLTIMSILILTPVPGSNILAIAYYRSCKRRGLQFDSSQLIEYGMPTLRLGHDDAEGNVDTSGTVYTTDAEIPLMKALDDLQGWTEKSKQFLTHDLTVDRTIKPPEPMTSVPLVACSYDAFRLIPELDPHAAFMAEALNTITQMPVDRVFTGNYKGDFTQAPENAKGNPIQMRTTNRFSTSNGLHYQANDKTQVLLTAATRYAVAQKQFFLDEEGRLLADEIAQNMFDKIIDVDKLATAWNDTETSSVYIGWLAKAKQAGYSNSHSTLAELDDRILRFQGKGSFKAKEDPVTLPSTAKAPQGILAWSKGANSFFGAACRMVTNVTRRSLKDCVVWNNGLTVDEAARNFVKAAARVPVDENVRLDAQEMDSKQNEFTHLIVRKFIEKLFVSSEFLDLYFSMMEDYRVTNPDLEMFLKWVKASGEPFTLYGNSFLMTAMTLWLIEGEGDFALFTQGDDVDLNQANMKINGYRLLNIQLYCNFEMTMEWGLYAAFCGYVLFGGQLVPNIRRKLIKLMGCNIRDIKHFQELQIAIRDWVDSLKAKLSFSDIIQVNANTYNVDYDTAETWFEIITSLGHLSAAQFLEAANKVELNTTYLRQSNTGRHDMIETVY